MEALRNILPTTERSFEKPDFRQMVLFKVDDYNARTGELDQRDGYNCNLCKNRGEIAFVKEENGIPSEWFRKCDCWKARSAIRMMKKSGLGNVIKEKTFELYNATEPWQQTLKAGAMAYAKDPSGWFFMGGQSGSGKSHLGAAICRHFLLAGKVVVYMPWLDDTNQLKTWKKDKEGGKEYTEAMRRYKEAEVLYVDDLFKTDMNEGARLPVTGADIRLAYEIINYRYNNPALLTIVSSEYFAGQLLDIDEALGGRIIEMAGANSYNVAKERSRNYRLKGVTVL